MKTTNHHASQPAVEGNRQARACLHTAPLAAATGGRLVFTSGATGVTLQTDPALTELYRAHFVSHIPSIHLEDEPMDTRPSAGVRLNSAEGAGQRRVAIHYRQQSAADWRTCGREPLAVITLNGAIPWEIEFQGGVARLLADLRGLQLRSLDLSDSSGVKVLLPQPTGNVYLYISGSASDVVMQRPVGVALRVQMAGSASQVQIDEQHFGAVATGIHWQTPDYGAATDRYDIHFASSVSNVTLRGTESPSIGAITHPITRRG